MCRWSRIAAGEEEGLVSLEGDYVALWCDMSCPARNIAGLLEEIQPELHQLSVCPSV